MAWILRRADVLPTAEPGGGGVPVHYHWRALLRGRYDDLAVAADQDHAVGQAATAPRPWPLPDLLLRPHRQRQRRLPGVRRGRREGDRMKRLGRWSLSALMA